MQAVITDNFIAPVVSNVTTGKYNTKAQAIELLTEQLTQPVKYKQSIEAIANDVDIAIEFGNGKVLAGMNKRINKEDRKSTRLNSSHVALPRMPSSA